jgi:hypothetical protein
MSMVRKRKKNWHAGLTRAEKAQADLIFDESVAAFYRERTTGKTDPGRLRGINAKEAVLAMRLMPAKTTALH